MKGDMTHSGCVRFCNKYIGHIGTKEFEQEKFVEAIKILNEYGTEILDIWAEILFHGKKINIS